jgi:RNA polymerase-binding transcription factor DksA
MKPAPKAKASKWAWHQRTLTQLRAELLKARQEHDYAVRVPHERGGADQLDVAEDEMELNTLRAELAQEDFELSEIESALRRLENGTYGICEATGKPIAAERPRAIPWTRLSTAAASRAEVAGRKPRAPERRRRR